MTAIASVHGPVSCKLLKRLVCYGLRCLYYDASNLVANMGWPAGVRSVELSLAVNATEERMAGDPGDDFRHVDHRHLHHILFLP